MLHKRLLTGSMAAAVALSAAGIAHAFPSDDDGSKEAAIVLAAETSVAQAVRAAEHRTGGRAARVEMESKDGTYLYEIKVAGNGKVSEVLVDPASGQVIRAHDEGFFARLFDWDDHVEFDQLATSPTTLSTAIIAAEKRAGGKAIEAETEKEHGQLLFEVKVVKANVVRKVTVDARNGTVIGISGGVKRARGDD